MVFFFIISFIFVDEKSAKHGIKRLCFNRSVCLCLLNSWISHQLGWDILIAATCLYLVLDVLKIKTTLCTSFSIPWHNIALISAYLRLTQYSGPSLHNSHSLCQLTLNKSYFVILLFYYHSCQRWIISHVSSTLHSCTCHPKDVFLSFPYLVGPWLKQTLHTHTHHHPVKRLVLM